MDYIYIYVCVCVCVCLLIYLYLYFRPGASSGILLGAVTLPALMLSKLTQMLRAIAMKEVEVDGIEYNAFGLKVWFFNGIMLC